MTSPITRTHRLAVARAWEVDERLTPFVQRWTETGNLTADVFAATIQTLERLAQLVADAEGAWIPCEERMPAHAESVLFWCRGWVKGAVFGLGRFLIDEDERQQFEDETQQDDDGPRMYPATEVTHWMPLPKPPERPVAVLDGEAPGPDEFACPYCGESCSVLIPVSYDAMVDGPGYVVEEEQCAKCVEGQP